VEVVTTEQLIEFVERTGYKSGWEGVVRFREELDTLGAPDSELVGAAVEGMASADRNVRVKMLRVLALLEDARATGAVLGALSDPARRVRDVAIKSTRPHHLSPEVIERLRAIVDDESEIDGIRRDAFFALSASVSREEVPDVAREAVVALMDSERFRLPLLIRLCKTSHHNEKSREVLQDFVDNGTKDEAVMATRALCGHQLVRIDGWLPNDVRQRVRATYDAAPIVQGVPSCWIPVADAQALAAEVGYPVAP
jgi:hypothetical protein